MKNLLQVAVNATDTRYTGLTPPLSEDDYQRLKADIRERGVLYDILRDEHGVTIDGYHRERAVAELRAEGHKIADPAVKVLPGLDEATKRSIARSSNLARRQLTAEQRRAMIEAQIIDTPRLSDRQIADKLGVTHPTVGAARERLVDAGRLEPQERTIGADGKSRPAKRPKPARCEVCGSSRSLDGTCSDCDIAEDDVVSSAPATCEMCGSRTHYDGACTVCVTYGPCRACGEVVYRQNGHIVDTPDGLRAAFHRACDTPDAGEDDQADADHDILGDCCECGEPVTRAKRLLGYDPLLHIGCQDYWRPADVADAVTDEQDAAERPVPAPAPAPTPMPKPIRIESAAQERKLHDLVAAGRIDAVTELGINAAHKQLREQRRHAEIREEATTAADKGDRVRVACTDALTFLETLDTGSVDMIWTDPPYYIASRGGGTKTGDSYATFNAGGDGWDDEPWANEDDFLEWLSRLTHACSRVLKPTGNLVMCTDRALISHLWDRCRLGDDVLTPRNVLAWHKTNAAPNARGNFDSALELAVWAVAGSGATFQRPATGQCANVWSGPFVSGPTRARWPHPTAKPVGWIQSHLEVLSTPGQLVVDPFGGSGATVEAALRLGRRVIVNDRSEKYADMCRARGAAVLMEMDAEVIA